MFNRTSRFIFAAALLVAMPVVAQASTSRLEGMALPVEYTKDYTAIYGWPASIVGVGNLVYGELGNQISTTDGSERAMGAVLPNLWDGKYGVWGLHLRETTPSLGQGDNTPTNSVFGGDPNLNNNEQFDLMWGKKFGSTNFGLRLNRSFEQEKLETNGVTTLMEFDQNGANPAFSRNIMGFGGGIGFTMNDKTDGEVAVLYQSRKFENSVTPGNKFEDNGGSTYLFQGRLMWKWQPNVMVVPVVKFYNFDLGTKNNVGGTVTTFDNSLRGWSAGLAGNWALGSNDLFVLGGTFAQNTVDLQNGTIANFDPKVKIKENMSPEVFMALETQVNSWLTLRMGARKGVFYQLKYDGTDSEFHKGQTQTIKYSPFTMNIGAGMKVGSLTFDAVLDNLFYNNPAAQFLGNSNSQFWDGRYVFQKVSATYTW